jgi:hypothetical protein
MTKMDVIGRGSVLIDSLSGQGAGPLPVVHLPPSGAAG